MTALEARRLRLLAGKPLAEVTRLWRLESADGTCPDAPALWDPGDPVDYAELARLEAAFDRRARHVCRADLYELGRAFAEGLVDELARKDRR